MEKKLTSDYDFDSLKNKKAMVIGDLIIDYYRFLKEKKLSPEAPVIVFAPVKEEIRSGGAANVANNLAILGFQSELFTAMGYSPNDEKFSKYLETMPFKTFSVKKKETTVKERLATSRQPLARIDIQNTDPLDMEEEKILTNKILDRLSEFSVVVFSDYAQGVLGRKFVSEIIVECLNKKIPVVVNSKSRDYIKYTGSTISIFNHNEAKDITGMVEFEDENVAKFIYKSTSLSEELQKKFNSQTAVALTRGPQGILLYTKNGLSLHHVVDSHEDDVLDVTGAGDTVTSSVAAGIVMGLNYEQQMTLGNIAASIVIKRRGTSCASPLEINEVREKINA